MTLSEELKVTHYHLYWLLLLLLLVLLVLTSIHAWGIFVTWSLREEQNGSALAAREREREKEGGVEGGRETDQERGGGI